MRALTVLPGKADSLELTERPDPTLGPNDLLAVVELGAAGGGWCVRWRPATGAICRRWAGPSFRQWIANDS